MEEITKQVKNSQSIKLGNNLIKRYHQEVTNQAYQKRMYLIIILILTSYHSISLLQKVL